MRYSDSLKTNTLAIGFLLILVVAIGHSHASQNLGQSLKDIPVFVGGMAFNEGYNDGFDKKQVVSWKSQDLCISSKGRLSGTIETEYSGPPVEYDHLKDVLFVQVQATYIWPRHGDLLHQPLSEIMPFVAQLSDAKSATFVLDGDFRIPQLVRQTDGSMPLKDVWLNLTWVRVYKKDNDIAFHIFPGDASRYYPNIARIQFDQDVESIGGRFGYYEVLRKGAYEGYGFDYQSWIRKNLNLR